jgi:hypothetical protein
VSRRRHGAGAREAAEEQRLTGAGTTDVGAREVVGTRRGRRGNGGGTERGAAVRRARRDRGCCRDAWRAVPTAALSHGVGAARGG